MHQPHAHSIQLNMRTLLVTIIATLLLISDIAQADMILGFSADGQISQFKFNSAPTIDVPIYLIQNGNENRLNEFGVVSFGLSGQFLNGKVAIDGFTFAGAFTDFREFTNSANSFQVFANVPFNAGGPNPGLVAAKGSPILLGTLTLRSTGAGDTLFRIGDYDPSQPSFSDFSFAGAASVDNLDHLLFNSDAQKSYSFSVSQITAVPEPTAVLGSVALLITVLNRARQRFNRGKKLSGNDCMYLGC